MTIDNILKEAIKEGKNFELSMDPLLRRRTGSYFTDIRLTNAMMEELIDTLEVKGKDITKLKFLEPCVGSGNFVFSYLFLLRKKGVKTEDFRQIIDNIYVADSNKEVLMLYKKSLTNIAYKYFNIELTDEYFSKNIGGPLLLDLSFNNLEYIPLEDAFDIKDKKITFDIVATNPPYKNLKAERRHYSESKDYVNDQYKYKEVSKIASSIMKYSNEGVLNLYKLFTEEILSKYLSKDGIASLLIPSSILTDKTSSKLRTFILEKNKLMSVRLVPEGSGYIDANQSLAALLIKNGRKTSSFLVNKDFHMDRNQRTKIDINDVLDENNGNAIYVVNEQEKMILNSLRKHPVIKELPFIINLRGELDMTTHRKYISKTDTGILLLKGRNIKFYENIIDNNIEYVHKDFFSLNNKEIYLNSERIACQQISNMKKEKRLVFSPVPKNSVLANSCNFIQVEPNIYGINIYVLLGLLNTKLLNWYFKIFSSNNHINNYEIDTFPIPVDSRHLLKIGEKAKEFIKTKDTKIMTEIEKLANISYGIIEDGKESNTENESEAIKNIIYEKYVADVNKLQLNFPEEILMDIFDSNSTFETYLFKSKTKIDDSKLFILEKITEKYRHLNHKGVLNHTTFKLSDLDMEMIKSVPQGGNWKFIPQETVEKSKRLMNITKTGGRTTLYGRIDYSKPSYTITTYFNRPGNGTYVHPIHNRVLTVREAARFQSFTDDYFIFGNQTQTLRQIGNAVPPLLAFQIGKRIKQKLKIRTSIDLFSGAGGLTLGFKEAGIDCVLATDFDMAACRTLKINNPEIEVLEADITNDDTKDYIIQKGIKNNVDLICGGPPCQGFSLAGLRLKDDPRNKLFLEFVEVVKETQPKVVVFENVVGILSFEKGQAFKAIVRLFEEIGYKTEARVLLASDYGVPQKRRRVIMICTREDIEIEPSTLFPKTITKIEEKQITAFDTISDLENITPKIDAKYEKDSSFSLYNKLMKRNITFEKYVNLLKGQ